MGGAPGGPRRLGHHVPGHPGRRRDDPAAAAGGFRYLIAGLILFPFAIRSGPAAAQAADRPRRANWLARAVVGVLLLLGGNGLVSVGERSLPSGFASLLVATVPLWLLVQDRVSRRFA